MLCFYPTDPSLCATSIATIVYNKYFKTLCCCRQYVELAFLLYELRITYAGVLYLISFAASLGAVWSLFWKRMELYLAIRQCSLVPIVQAGRVRFAACKKAFIMTWTSTQPSGD